MTNRNDEITPAALKTIIAACDEATLGPWSFTMGTANTDIKCDESISKKGVCRMMHKDEFHRERDATFIVAARVFLKPLAVALLREVSK